MVLVVCVGFLLGVAGHALDEQVWGVGEWWWVAVMLGLVVVLFRKIVGGWLVVRMAMIFLLAVYVATWRYDVMIEPRPITQWPEETVLVEGRVSGMSEWREKGSRMVLVAARWDGGGSSGDGVVVSLSTRPEFLPGDVVRVFCKPRALNAETKPYLAKRILIDQVGAECRATLEPDLVSRGEWSLERGLGILVVGTRQRVSRLFAEPYASFLLGLLAGDDGGLPYALKQQFRATGTSHILAVSGYNVTKVVLIFSLLYAAVLIPRRWASLVAIGSVALFVMFTGAEASVVRAGVMTGFVLLARALGRPASQPRALVYVATLMLVVNPLALRYDLGFTLSFAAVMGLMVFSQLCGKLYCWLPQRFGLAGSAAETTAATLGTAPLSLHSFGVLPWFAVPVNVLVLPAIPIAMAAGFLAVLLDMVWSPLAKPLVWVTWLAMWWVIEVTGLAAKYFYQAWHARLGLGGMLLVHVGLLLLVLVLRKILNERNNDDHGGSHFS